MVETPGDRTPRGRRRPGQGHRGGGTRAFALGLVLALTATGVSVAPLGAQEGERPSPADLRHPVLVDPSLSTFATTVTLQTAVTGLYALESRHVPVRVGQEDDVGGKALGLLYRLGRLTLLDVPLVNLHAVVRHEVAGHGGRVRRAGGDVTGYGIDLPPPYGPGGGETRFRFEEGELLQLEAAAVSAGGLESALVDAVDLEARWVARGRMDVREGLQYVRDLTEVVGYIADARPGDPREGHDVESYVGLVNFGAPDGAAGDPVTVSGLEDASVVEILNPAYYWALYGVIWRFLVQGESDGPVPALEIGSARVMPSVHLRLAPFGPEYVVGLTAARDGRVVRAGFRLVRGPWGTSPGLELEGRRLLEPGERFTLGGRLGVWRQWDVAAGSAGGRVGAMAVARATASFRDLPVDGLAELGLKTEGYAPGEALDAGPIARVGLTVPLRP